MDRSPQREFVSIFITPADYREFVLLLSDDPRLPLDYTGWLQSLQRYSRAIEVAGLKEKPVEVSPTGFARFAVKVGMAPSYALLHQYALYVDRHNSAG